MFFVIIIISQGYDTISQSNCQDQFQRSGHIFENAKKQAEGKKKHLEINLWINRKNASLSKSSSESR